VIFSRDHCDDIALTGADILDLSVQLQGVQMPGDQLCDLPLTGTVREGSISGVNSNQFA
jgi:hypothetical protein